MKNFGIFIISYLSDDSDIRDKRLNVHKKQLDWWLKYTDIDINILSMNYKDEDKTKNERISYYDFPSMKTNKAWYERFKIFYASKYKWGIMLDDDSVLYNAPEKNYNSAHRIFSEMSEHIEDYNDIGCFFPHNPQKLGFKKILENTLYDFNHIFERNMDLKGSMFVLRNFKLYGEDEIYNDLDFIYCEDTSYAMTLVNAGKTVFKTTNMILNEYSHGASNFTNKNNRTELMKEANQKIAKKYNIKMKKDSHLLDRTKFLKEKWIGQNKKIIPKN